MENEYILITPARNEEGYVEETIQSVISQTILPKRWIIVSDGSTDRTDEIVSKYAEKYEFIQLMRANTHSERNFGSKVDAFNFGYQRLKNIKYDYIGNLDADITFESDYFERIIGKFNSNSKLGVAGGWIHELHNGKYRERWGNRIKNVPGAIQLFRRKCFEEIGGYIPFEKGGIDTIAEAKVRMHGWEVKSFPSIYVFHHRCTGFNNSNMFSNGFRGGIKHYTLGYHPIYEVAYCVRRLGYKPYIIGSFLNFAGYFWSFFLKENRPLPLEFVKFLREEQLERLKAIFKKISFMRVFRK